MTIVRWNPRRDMLGLRDEMDHLFGNFFGLPGRYVERNEPGWTPRVNVRELDDKFVLTAEIPGMNKDDIKVEVKDHQLMITGEKKKQEDKNGKDYHVCEICYGKFERAFTLPDNVDTRKIDAEYTDGILNLGIPKTEEAKPKEIKVKVN